MTIDSNNVVAFQGAPGAYSDLACREVFPDMQTLPCRTFADAFAAVEDGRAGRAMIPIENSVAGRVADIHQMLPDAGLHFIGEHFQRVRHQLLGVVGAGLSDIKTVRSHVHALSQCRKAIDRLNLQAVVHADTAGAAAEVAERNDKSMAAIASTLAAKTYGLEILEADIEDEAHNTTRFIVLAAEPINPDPAAGTVVTSFVFRVRNVSAALYKAMGGFATNGVNMTKLESYMVGGAFTATQFFAEVEAHPSDIALQNALEELEFFSHEVRIMGVYPAHPFRVEAARNAE